MRPTLSNRLGETKQIDMWELEPKKAPSTGGQFWKEEATYWKISEEEEESRIRKMAEFQSEAETELGHEWRKLRLGKKKKQTVLESQAWQQKQEVGLHRLEPGGRIPSGMQGDQCTEKGVTG